MPKLICVESGKLFIICVLVVYALYLLFSNKEGYEGDKVFDETKNELTNELDKTPENILPSDLTGINNSSYATDKLLATEPAGENKTSQYSKNNRSGDLTELDKFFDGNTGEADNSMFASYKSTDNGAKMTDKDKFDASALLPVEKNKEWFDDPYEETSVKNVHLINIHRPVGVNTIQSSLKNPSHDLRGTIPNPKFVVSPWQNSSIEPDMRGNRLCAPQQQ